MENFKTEFQSISKTYREAGKVLDWITQMDESQSSTLAKSIMENRDCFGRIEQMHSKVLHLSSRWKQCRENTDTKTWEEINRLADDALQQAVRLNQLCSITANRLQSAKDRLGAEMGEIGKGARFLKSASPTKGNFPKFIDSMY